VDGQKLWSGTAAVDEAGCEGTDFPRPDARNAPAYKEVGMGGLEAIGPDC